jgi:predicted nucleic acid-binding protein
VIGSAGILLAAKARGLLPAVAPILATWREWGYFLAPALLEAVLIRAGEND